MMEKETIRRKAGKEGGYRLTIVMLAVKFEPPRKVCRVIDLIVQIELHALPVLIGAILGGKFIAICAP